MDDICRPAIVIRKLARDRSAVDVIFHDIAAGSNLRRLISKKDRLVDVIDCNGRLFENAHINLVGINWSMYSGMGIVGWAVSLISALFLDVSVRYRVCADLATCRSISLDDAKAIVANKLIEAFKLEKGAKGAVVRRLRRARTFVELCNYVEDAWFNLVE